MLGFSEQRRVHKGLFGVGHLGPSVFMGGLLRSFCHYFHFPFSALLFIPSNYNNAQAAYEKDRRDTANQQTSRRSRARGTTPSNAG